MIAVDVAMKENYDYDYGYGYAAIEVDRGLPENNKRTEICKIK